MKEDVTPDEELSIAEYAEKYMDFALHPKQERMVAMIMQGNKVISYFPRRFGTNTAKLVAEKYQKYLKELTDEA